MAETLAKALLSEAWTGTNAALNGGHARVEAIITSRKHKPRLVSKTAWVKSLVGVESNLPRVYTPERNPTLPFADGRINPLAISKIVDENGELLVVYHETGKDFGEGWQHDED